VETWTIDAAAYQKWLGERAVDFDDNLKLGNATVRSVVFLALLDLRGRPATYSDINEIIKKRKAVRTPQKARQGGGALPVPTLRVALSDLSKTLPRSETPFRLKTLKVGRESKMELVDSDGSAEPMASTGGRLVGVTEESAGIQDPRAIARELVRDGGGLPFACLYSTYRAAAWWLSFSTKTAAEKKVYEAEALEAYGIPDKLAAAATDGRICVVALAPGEGLGESEMLRRLLKRKDNLKIDYLAVDTSDILLMSHSKLIGERFSDEMRSGRLRYCPVIGDLYRLGALLPQARLKMGDGFLKPAPTLCTFLGNCIGNYENHEWDFFISVKEAFSQAKVLSFLVGASVLRRTGAKEDGPPQPESYTLDPFTLETPRHLLHDLELLISTDAKGNPIPLDKNREFLYDPEAEEFKKVIPAQDYSTPQGIRGQVYRFYYTLKNRLTTWDQTQVIPAGERILLYSIIKFELASLARFLEARGFEVKTPPRDYPYQVIVEGEEAFKYGVFAASLSQ
jgi:hypothetical protein